jgi:ethanolamine ammonia-lyase large subunit
MKNFFVRIGILDAEGNFTSHAGDPLWVYYQYRLAKGDGRSREEIFLEGEAQMARVQARDVPLAIGHGAEVGDMKTELAGKIQALYEDAKKAIWTRLSPEFIAGIPDALLVSTLSKDREQYIARPETGEKLDSESIALLANLRDSWRGSAPDVQILISDGLNAISIMAADQLGPYLDELRRGLGDKGWKVGAKNIVVPNGRVRAGYRIGEILFRDAVPEAPKAIVYIIGERPGTGQNAYSVYFAAPKGRIWSAGQVDHDIARVVSGISLRGTIPREAARQTIRLLEGLMH